MSQPSLPFAKITTEAWRAQVQQTAAAAAVAAAVRPAAPAARPVGRPKRALNAPDILSAAAAAEQPETEQPSKKPRSTVARGKYTNWFDSPYINDILRAYEHSGYRCDRSTGDAVCCNVYCDVSCVVFRAIED